jgi:hypothetical protein
VKVPDAAAATEDIMGGSHEEASGRGDAACRAETALEFCPEDVAAAGQAAGRQRRAPLPRAAGWLALLLVAGCLAHGCVATGISESLLEPVPPMDELPAELLEELAMMEEGHPTMRRLLAEVWTVGLNSPSLRS